jgi:PhzF family phenazine biosynthesis protein
MLGVAREMNCAETAFAVPHGDGFDLRWFGVAGEVELCGHATLATAHVLWETGQLSADALARFQTRSGPLTATRTRGLIELDFPADPVLPVDPPAGLVNALGIVPTFVGRSRFYMLAEAVDEATVRTMRPDFRRLAEVVSDGIVVTARSDDPHFAIFSRFFAPAIDNDEDPATGSSACLLAPYWAARLGSDVIVARQERQPNGRGGTIQMTLRGDRVGIAGEAVTVLRGEIAD